MQVSNSSSNELGFDAWFFELVVIKEDKKVSEPPFRFSTKKALDELANELELRKRIPCWDAMAGYSYTPGNPEDIQQYLDYYVQLKDDDKRFTLMEMILDAIAEQPNETEFLKFWQKVKPILIKNYLLHEFTVHYWKNMTVEFSRSNIMTPLIRNLIILMNSKEDKAD